MPRSSKQLGVGMVGYKFMGRTHSNAYRQMPRFFDTALTPAMRAICGRDERVVRQAADELGWEGYETDYRRLIERDDIDLVDISTPGDSHRDIALAALAAGKHVFCEKPLANTVDEAREMRDAAHEAYARSGAVAVVNFNYRRVPAVQLARKLVSEGRIGEVRHWRATYLQDFVLDPEFPLIWRFQKEKAGSGALGDIGAHIVDLGRFIVGDIARVVGTMETFIRERPLEESSGGLSGTGGAEKGAVTVDDCAAFIARFENGATGTFEATRLAPGRKNRNSFEVNGSKGSIFFDFERMNELQVCFADDPPEVGGFRTVMVTEPDHHYMDAWWPAGHPIGYEHTFIHAVKDLLDGVATGENPAPTFEDGYRCQAVLDAVERSVETGGWTEPEALEGAGLQEEGVGDMS